MKKHLTIFAVLAISIILAAAVIIAVFNPIVSLRFSSEGYIKRGILKSTPIGTNVENVVDYINQNDKWTFSTSGGAKSWSMLSEDEIDEIYRSGSSIYVCIGEYGNISKTDVQVIWFFDNNSKVENIYVRKITNSF